MKKVTALFKRKSFWIVFSAAAVVIVVSLTVFLNTPKQIYLRNKAEFSAAAESILKSQDADDINIRSAVDVSYWDGKSQIVEFMTGGYGLAPSSTYKGIYYSADGSPVPFQNSDIPLTQTEKGWSWEDSDGNWGTTEHIEGNWFTYEAHF